MIEEMWARDVTDLFWETLRLRRLKATLMKAAAPLGLESLIEALTYEGIDSYSRSRDWGNWKSEGLKYVQEILATAGLDEDAIAAETLSIRIDVFERIDRMILQSEVRRNAALRDIERWRSAAGERLRKAVEDITEVEIEEAPPIAHGTTEQSPEGTATTDLFDHAPGS
jgi:hypothetical protein